MERYYLPGEDPSILHTFHTLFKSMDERRILKEVADFFDRTQAPIDLQDEQTSTMLHWACSRGHEEVVPLLLVRGANPNMTAWEDKTPLHSAMGHDGSTRILDLLVQYGADIEARDAYGRTPLHRAVEQAAVLASRSLPQVSHMINLGADLLAQDIRGNRPADMLVNYSFLGDDLAGIARCAIEAVQLQARTEDAPNKLPRSRL